MDTVGQELRLAARRLHRAPAFTVATVLTLALAIGANTAIFAVVRNVVVNPLPYPESDRLIALQYIFPQAPGPATAGMPVALYYQYADRARTLADIAIYRRDESTITAGGREPYRASVAHTTPSLASVLRTAPALGRWFTAEEGGPGAPAVAILSHGLWVSRYGSDPNVIGRMVTMDGTATAIVGVMPETFSFLAQPQAVDIWLADRVSRPSNVRSFSHNGVARLRDGATAANARAELTRLIADLPQAYPGDPTAIALATRIKLRSEAIPLKDATLGGVGRALWMLLGAVGLVLLVACANVANLFLVRSDARQRELAVRQALGAGRRGVVRFFLAESVLLSSLGGLGGLTVAYATTRLLVVYGPLTLPRLHEVRLDAVGVMFVLALCVITALAVGTAPLLRRTPLAAVLGDSGRGNTASRTRHRARQTLMGAQVALALVVLIASALMVRSFQQLRRVDPGFDASNRLTFRIGLPPGDYPTRATIVGAHHAIIDRLSAVPGIAAVSAVSALPLQGQTWGNVIRVDGAPPPEDIRQQPLVEFHAIAGGYLDAMGLRLIRGRGISRGEVDRGEQQVVVNQALVDAYLVDQDPVGIRIASATTAGAQWLTIVGVVANTPSRALNEPSASPKLYVPMSIAGGPDVPAQRLQGPNPANLYYVARTTSPPSAVLAQAHAAISTVDPMLAMSQVAMLQELLDRSASQMAFTMVLLAIAGAVALLLGVVGVYGVMSYIVSQRVGEIGVRLALGAAPLAVAGMIARQGGLVAAAGVAIGVAVALAGGRAIESLLYGVSPRDPAVFATMALMLLGVAWYACWLPARQATQRNPLEALRPE